MCILQVKGGYSLSLLRLREDIKEGWVELRFLAVWVENACVFMSILVAVLGLDIILFPFMNECKELSES